MSCFCRQGHLSMVVCLMSYGADPSLRDGEGIIFIYNKTLIGHKYIKNSALK